MTGMPKTKIKAVVARDQLASLCMKYEDITRKRDELRSLNARVFAMDRGYSDELTTLEEAIKKEARPGYEGQPRGTYVAYVGPVATVSATAKWSKKVDAEGLLDEIPELRSVPGLLVQTINRAMLAELMKTEQISEVAAAAHTTESQETTAIKFERTEADESGQLAEVVPRATVVTRIR